MKFLISDTHFFHENIIKYCNRPFESIEGMHQQMIDKWNEVVSPGDTIIHVGDFSLGSMSQSSDMLNKLNGYKVLVRGNHDKTSAKMEEMGFNLVVESMKVVHDGTRYFIVHNPPHGGYVPSMLKVVECDKLIHGHYHNNEEYRPTSKSYNISCEWTNYGPISFDNLDN